MSPTPVVEPPINRNYGDLDPDFRARLIRVLDQLEKEGIPFKFNEGYRTKERQQWLYGSGRLGVRFGRKGPIVTQKNGTTNLSNHQGTGEPGTGCAADCYPMDPNTKRVVWPPPPSTDPRWHRYAKLAEENGLVAGYRWTKPNDPPHIELRKS